MAGQLWEVVGGGDKGGIIVRSGIKLDSQQEEQRLATGSLVREKQLEADRLQYELVEGSGPKVGWVSTKLKDKALLVKTARVPASNGSTGSSSKQTIFDFDVVLADGSSKKLREWKSSATLVVNTASKCGFTSQYKGLQELQKRFGPGGLNILAFPCNQFMAQEPGDNRSIQEFVKSEYGITFPVFGKADVNGEKAMPLFNFLKTSLDTPVPKPPWAKKLHPNEQDIQWNFTKFLCIDGVPYKRYSWDVDPSALVPDIEAALKSASPSSQVSPASKRRILFLHGSAGSEHVFRTQLAKLLPTLQDDFEFTFLEGRLPVTEGSAYNTVQQFFPGAKLFNHDTVSLDHKGWRVYKDPEGTLAWLQEEISRKGPFAGVIGFSQGANFANMLAAQASSASLKASAAPLDFVVLLCPNAPGYIDQLPEIFAQPITVRGLVVYGDQETYSDGMQQEFEAAVKAGKLVQETRGEEKPARHVAKLYVKAEVFAHKEGHRPLPGRKDDVEKVIGLIKNFVNEA